MFSIYNIKTAMNDALLAIGTDQNEPMCRPADTEVYFPADTDKRTGVFPYIEVSYPFRSHHRHVRERAGDADDDYAD